ncbi:MAG: SH3 domain-containing protein [Hyphomonadaceae bacterium]
MDGIVGLIELVAKTIALGVAFVFWGVIGFFIWARLVVISFVLFTAQVMLSPFSGDKNNSAARRFRAAIRLWPEGFGMIINTIRGVERPGDDETRMSALDENDAPRARGFWSSVVSFLWQTTLAVVFWAPLILFAHFSDMIDIGPLDRLEARIERMLEPSEAPAEPNRAPARDRAEAAPARTETSGARDETAAPAGPSCLGDRAVQRVNPAQRFVTRRDVNVRRGPGTEHQRLERLRGGQEVSVIGRSPSGQWALIQVDGVTRCFVNADYLVRRN